MFTSILLAATLAQLGSGGGSYPPSSSDFGNLGTPMGGVIPGGDPGRDEAVPSGSSGSTSPGSSGSNGWSGSAGTSGSRSETTETAGGGGTGTTTTTRTTGGTNSGGTMR
jgi:hypothetical protein